MPVILSVLILLLKKPFASETSIVKYRSVNVFLLPHNCTIVTNVLFSTWPYLHPSRTVLTLLLLLFGGKEIEVGKLLFKVFKLFNSL